ncbi:MAG: MogA/MoaB family molybdenum cofactor biosynthesis protein [Acidimicrobiales bacterium]|jgi:molybdenum cofactor synthesis domain-containing protein
MTRHAKVLTVSTSVAAQTREDESGEALVALLTSAGFAVVDRLVIPDGEESVADALIHMSDGFSGLIVTTGGTGFSPNDLTPEGTARVLDRLAPGIAEAMRATNRLGRLSRGRAGTRAGALIINLPGSPRAVQEQFAAVGDVLEHILDLMAGGRPH